MAMVVIRTGYLHDHFGMPVQHACPQIEALQESNGYSLYSRRYRTAVVEPAPSDDGADR